MTQPDVKGAESASGLNSDQIQGRIHMSNMKLSRRRLLATGAGAGGALAAPTLFTGASWAAGHTGFTNAPTGDTVTIGYRAGLKLLVESTDG